MRGAALTVAVMALSSCGASPPPPVANLPPSPPADVALACAMPPVARDAYDALLDHRLALVECRGAALVNDAAWRRIAAGR